jgi:hypothetical protein
MAPWGKTRGQVGDVMFHSHLPLEFRLSAQYQSNQSSATLVELAFEDLADQGGIGFAFAELHHLAFEEI